MEPPYAPNTVNQTVTYNGNTFKGNPGSGWTLISGGNSGGGGAIDPVALAKQLNDLTVQANQPAIATLGSTISTTQSKYDDLVASIKGAGTVAHNAATLTASNELGARGILSNSTYGQQQIQGAQLPVDTAYAGQAAQTGLAGQQDINSINSAIAQLQAGNPANSVNAASGYAGAAAGANATIQASQNALAAARSNPYAALGQYGASFNTQTGSVSTTGIQQLINSLRGVV